MPTMRRMRVHLRASERVDYLAPHQRDHGLRACRRTKLEKTADKRSLAVPLTLTRTRRGTCSVWSFKVSPPFGADYLAGSTASARGLICSVKCMRHWLEAVLVALLPSQRRRPRLRGVVLPPEERTPPLGYNSCASARFL